MPGTQGVECGAAISRISFPYSETVAIVGCVAVLPAELLAFCRSELSAYKCPRTVDFTDELPRDPNGKLYKRLLRERYWQGHDSLVS